VTRKLTELTLTIIKIIKNNTKGVDKLVAGGGYRGRRKPSSRVAYPATINFMVLYTPGIELIDYQYYFTFVMFFTVQPLKIIIFNRKL